MEHFPVRFDDCYGGAYGLLCKKPPTTGMIFAHGFEGNPRNTWVDFPGLVEQVRTDRIFWSECDLLFYAYRSHDQVRPLAEQFVEFLTRVASAKETPIIGSNYVLPSSEKLTLGVPADLAGLRGPEPYRNLVLVGHSTGAVIIREALRLIVATMEGDPRQPLTVKDNLEPRLALITESRLRFFAPAHLGVIAAGMLGLVQSLPILDRIAEAYLRSNPLYQNLRPEGPTINDLRKDTENFYTKHKLPALKASSIFGQHEEVVYIGGYSHDQVMPTVAGHSHTTVCKPTQWFLKPLEFVSDASAMAKIA